MPEVTLGIDTSCYTTSVAFASDGRIVYSNRRLLRVEKGQRGLRQSEAVFQHVKALPELLGELFAQNPDANVAAVCASQKPVDAENSYMPVFQAGLSFAEALASGLRVPLFCTTHQQGHIRAAMVDSGLPSGDFLALHLSGGTTQSLLVKDGLRVTDLGGSSDLNAGQLVDRTGVMLGMTFPCGPEMEKLALGGKSKSRVPMSRFDDGCSFSGAENKLRSFYEAGMAKEDVAMELYDFLARCVLHLILTAQKKTGLSNVLLAGGVASSALLKRLLSERLKARRYDVKPYWARPELSGDNACGVALIGDEKRRGVPHGDID